MFHLNLNHIHCDSMQFDSACIPAALFLSLEDSEEQGPSKRFQRAFITLVSFPGPRREFYARPLTWLRIAEGLGSEIPYVMSQDRRRT